MLVIWKDDTHLPPPDVHPSKLLDTPAFDTLWCTELSPWVTSPTPVPRRFQDQGGLGSLHRNEVDADRPGPPGPPRTSRTAPVSGDRTCSVWGTGGEYVEVSRPLWRWREGFLCNSTNRGRHTKQSCFLRSYLKLDIDIDAHDAVLLNRNFFLFVLPLLCRLLYLYLNRTDTDSRLVLFWHINFREQASTKPSFAWDPGLFFQTPLAGNIWGHIRCIIWTPLRPPFPSPSTQRLTILCGKVVAGLQLPSARHLGSSTQRFVDKSLSVDIVL